MTDYQSFFKYQSASSHDMEERMTEQTGINMSNFFENWVYQAGTPHFSIDSFAITQNGTNYLVDVYVKQKRKGSSFLGNDNVMYIDFIGSEWETITDTLHFSGLTGHKQFTIPYLPEMVVSDYGDRIFDARINYNLTIKNIGLVNFDGSYFKLETENIEDSTLFRIEHHWVAPDSLKDPVATLKISDYHYWTVDGIFSNNFTATGIFKYSKSNYMDNTLILSDQDSTVLLYRPNASVDWEMVYTERIGFWNSGLLYLDNIQKGDYALGVVDVNYVGIDKKGEKKKILQLFPNPTSDTFYLQSEVDGLAKLYSAKGEMLEKKLLQKNQRFDWDISNVKEGVYFILFVSEDKSISVVKKISKM
jgi:aminopeptidase N